MTQAPAGWYPQPDGMQRYWDGSAWTDHIAPGAALATPPAPPVAAVPPVADAPPVLAAPPAPPGQQAAYAAMPSAAPVGKPRKRVWPWVLGIGGGVVVVVIALVVWGVVAFLGAVKGPGDAVTALDVAWRNGDCAAMQKLMTAEVRASSGWDDCAAFQAATPTDVSGLSLHVDSTSITNDVATVITTEHWADGADPHTGTYTLIKVSGDWTISNASFD